MWVFLPALQVCSNKGLPKVFFYCLTWIVNLRTGSQHNTQGLLYVIFGGPALLGFLNTLLFGLIKLLFGQQGRVAKILNSQLSSAVCNSFRFVPFIELLLGGLSNFASPPSLFGLVFTHKVENTLSLLRAIKQFLRCPDLEYFFITHPTVEGMGV